MTSSDTDPRLKEKVEYAGSAVQLHEVLENLSRQTGVALIAGQTQGDWRVRERKLHVQLRDLPLETALTQIGKTLDYRITRSGKSGEWTYRIWQDEKAREREQNLRDDWNEQARDVAKSTMKKVFRDAETALALSPEEAMKLRDENPWMAFIGGTEPGRSYCKVVLALPEWAKERAVEGGKVKVPVSELPEEVRSLLPHLAKAGMLQKRPHKIEKLVPVRLIIRRWKAAYWEDDRLGFSGDVGYLRVVGEGPEPAAERGRMYIDDIDGGETIASVDLMDADSESSRHTAEWVFRMYEGERPKDFLRELNEKDDERYRNIRLSKIVPTPPPDDPRLQITVEPIEIEKADDGAVRIGKILEHLADATGLSFVLEFHSTGFFSFRYAYTDLPTDAVPAHRVLDHLQTASLAWDCEDSVVHIRPIDWFVQREHDVPEQILEHYRDILRDKGWFDVDDLAAICFDLTYEQIQTHVMTDDQLEQAAIVPFTSPVEVRALRFYAGLSADQKKRIKSPEGLDFGLLSPHKKQELSEVIEEDVELLECHSGTVKLEVAYREEDTGDLNIPGPHFQDFTFSVTIERPEAPKPGFFLTSFVTTTKAGLEMMKKLEERHEAGGESEAKDLPLR